MIKERTAPMVLHRCCFLKSRMPVYYIRTAFKGSFGKFLAGFFAVAIVLALGFMGCMVQSNSIGSTMSNAFGIPSWIPGIVLVIICGIIFLGSEHDHAEADREEWISKMRNDLYCGWITKNSISMDDPVTSGMSLFFSWQTPLRTGG